MMYKQTGHIFKGLAIEACNLFSGTLTYVREICQIPFQQQMLIDRGRHCVQTQ